MGIKELMASVERKGGMVGEASQLQAVMMDILGQACQSSRYVAAHVAEAKKQGAPPELVVAGIAVEALARLELVEMQCALLARALEQAGLLKVVTGEQANKLIAAQKIAAPEAAP